MTCRPSRDKQTFSQSGDVIKVARLDTGEKVAPLIRRELTNRTIGVVGISDQDIIASTCDLDASAAFACARFVPVKVPWG